MKIALFIFVPLTVFSIATYMYLYQKQDKFIPKDKYDKAKNGDFREKPAWNIRFYKSNNIEIGMGLGFLSCFILFLLLIEEFSANSKVNIFLEMISGVVSCIGSFAAIAGFFIGAFGTFQEKNRSSTIRYEGVLFSALGLFNIFFLLKYFVPIAMLIALIFGEWIY
ncbi:MAG: hypothetical protein JNM55_08935 [Anaerolineales bacterium]|nr:hypothetical protein [Anaerolineales bacterium]